MRLLYGVQATGQGHISRARAMAEALRPYDIEVTWLFSGRPKDQLFDMEPFENFEHRSGLTFVTQSGQLQYVKTAVHNNLWRFVQDVRSLNLERYDLIVTDYEPVTAWAAKLARRQIIGIGHQYAFGSNTPVAGHSLLQRTVMRWFAPVDRPVGLHWAAFDSNVLPPILDLPQLEANAPDDFFLVYLPFEHQDKVTQWLQAFPEHRFKQYAGGLENAEQGNVLRCSANISGFKSDLGRCRGVICNSGFELISECLQWRKSVLTRPLQGQMEQLSNAAALAQLNYARVMYELDTKVTRAWLANPPAGPELHFHNVAEQLAHWLAHGATEPIDLINHRLWA